MNAQDLIDAIDQLDCVYSRHLNDICVVKSEVIEVIKRYGNTHLPGFSEEMDRILKEEKEMDTYE